MSVTISQTGETPEAGTAWPDVPARDGEFYGFHCAVHGTEMLAMTQNTWHRLTQELKIMQSRLNDLSRENIEFKQGRKPNVKESVIITLNPTGEVQ